MGVHDAQHRGHLRCVGDVERSADRGEHVVQDRLYAVPPLLAQDLPVGGADGGANHVAGAAESMAVPLVPSGVPIITTASAAVSRSATSPGAVSRVTATPAARPAARITSIASAASRASACTVIRSAPASANACASRAG